MDITYQEGTTVKVIDDISVKDLNEISSKMAHASIDKKDAKIAAGQPK